MSNILSLYFVKTRGLSMDNIQPHSKLSMAVNTHNCTTNCAILNK